MIPLRRLWAGRQRFPGGLTLEAHKAESTRLPIERLPMPPQLVLPLGQHIGAAARACVAVGDRVEAGQCIALADGNVSANLHSPADGHVTAIEPREITHPSGLVAPCIVIATDGDRAPPPVALAEALDTDPHTLREALRQAGVVGLGGAAFPTAVKLGAASTQAVDLLVVNGAECEPYITCDDMLMRERAGAVMDGVRLMMHILGVRKALIGVEDNKPQAIAALTAVLPAGSGIAVVAVPTRYPVGGERQLIVTLTGRRVPSGALPAAVGVICQNVGTAAAVHDALRHSLPLTRRLVTVAGAGVRTPRVLDVPIGAPLSALIDYAGGYSLDHRRLVIGGPMMGFAPPHDRVPVSKGTNAVLVLPAQAATEPKPCIRCGECVDVCPASLLPQQLYWHARAQDHERARELHLFDCIECGCCAAVCPSEIPLVQYYRHSKGVLAAQAQERVKADIARRRYDEHIARQAREAAERAARLAQKKAGLATAGTDKQAAIAAAKARAQARKQAAAEADDP